MNYSIVLRLLAMVMLALAGAFLLSAAVGFYYSGEDGVTGFGVATAVALALAAPFYAFGRGGKDQIFSKEALAVIGLGWLTASLVGSIPYLMILPGVSFADAFFESASGLTTTGASVFSSLESMPHSLMFWRCLSQWIGGLGVVVLFVAVLSYLGAGGKILFSRESSGQSADIFDGRMQTGAKRIMGLYLVISGLCAASYYFAGLGGYDAFCHMFTTVSTGGFSTRSASIAAFKNPVLEVVCIGFMFICGISFILILRVLRGEARALQRNSEAGGYVLILLVASAVVTSAVWFRGEVAEGESVLRAGVFQVVSIMTTTGFGTADFDQWPTIAQIVLVSLMFVGGCSGSTAGGLKVIRLVTGLKIVLNHLERSFRTRVIRPVRVNGKNLNQDERFEAILFLLLGGIIIAVGVAWVGFFESDADLVTAFSAVVASLFNIGPGLGAVGPMENFAAFSDPTKIFLGILMITGRLEFYAILVLFLPGFWKRFS